MRGQGVDGFELCVLRQMHDQMAFAEQNSHLEFGRVLKAAMAQNTGISCGYYVNRFDEATRVEQVTGEWIPLRPLMPEKNWELELFDSVIGFDAEQLALNSNGEWLVRSDLAVEMMKSQRDSEKRARSEVRTFALLFAIAAVAGIAIATFFS